MPEPYKKMLAVLALNGIFMFLLTYALVNQSSHIHFNLNRAYMAIIMVAPMAVVMLLFMKKMYADKKMNAILITAFTLVFVATFTIARAQVFIGDSQFLRSMISHHSSAIVMCERSDITDSDIISLCEDIVETQKREIAEMEELLTRY